MILKYITNSTEVYLIVVTLCITVSCYSCRLQVVCTLPYSVDKNTVTRLALLQTMSYTVIKSATVFCMCCDSKTILILTHSYILIDCNCQIGCTISSHSNTFVIHISSILIPFLVICNQFFVQPHCRIPMKLEWSSIKGLS